MARVNGLGMCVGSAQRLEAMLQHWRLGSVQHCGVLHLGRNNRSWRVQTSDGAYVLRVSRTSTDSARLELAAALIHVCLLTARNRSTEPWPWVDQFCTGYGSIAKVAIEEVSALPTLIRLRRIVIFLHWMGRWEAGLSAREDALEQLDDALDLDTWLQANSGQLLDRVAAVA
jgi:Ser/Thr protein kinase RdoA (MazF antagonist)